MGTMAVFDMLEREKRKESQMYINKGKREGMIVGKREGILVGERNGIRKRNLEIAQKLLLMKLPIQQIKEATGLTEKEILTINEAKN